MIRCSEVNRVHPISTATPTSPDAFRVRLDAFDGPLDLLLFLIRKHEVDILDIPLASIAEEYLALLSAHRADLGRLDIDAAGEFLVMAATLTEIKSRMLMPRPQAGGETQDRPPEGSSQDPRAELVRQLLEYKRYRDAADALESKATERQGKFKASAARIDAAALQELLDEQAETDLEDLSLTDLVEAFRKIVETVNFDRLGDHQVTYDDTPIELHAEDILSRLDERRAAGGADAGVDFRDFFTGRTRGEMIGLFLALLELVRNRRVAVRQDRVEGVILLERREESAPPPAATP
jgi:segregation and condensation protein A